MGNAFVYEQVNHFVFQSTPVVPNLFYSVAPDQCVIISMAPINACNFSDLITINYVYARDHTYKTQYNMNSSFQIVPWPPRKYAMALRLGTTGLHPTTQILTYSKHQFRVRLASPRSPPSLG